MATASNRSVGVGLSLVGSILTVVSPATQFRAPDGSTGVAGILFASAVGFRRTANDSFRLVSNGVDRVYFNETQTFFVGNNNNHQVVVSADTSLAACPIFPQGDADTGISFPGGANTISLVAGGVEALRATATGVVVGGNITMGGGGNMVLDASTGTKIGTSTTQKLAFHNATPIVQETVTGSRGGNAALADLLTKLANKGLIVDGSSA